MNTTVKLTFNDELSDCLVRAKTLAIREGSQSVTCAHIARAAVLQNPDVANAALAAAGVGSLPAEATEPTEPSDPAAAERLPLSPDVEAALFRERVTHQIGTFGLHGFLSALLENPSNRLQVCLEALGLTTSHNDRSSCADEEIRPYESLREYLRDQAGLWNVRRRVGAAFQAQMRSAPASGVVAGLDELRALESRIDRRVAATESSGLLKRLRLSHLSSDAREVLTGLVVQEIYELDECRCAIEVREAALWIRPERFPENCGEILDAVRTLAAQHLVACSNLPPRLDSDLSLGPAGGNLLREVLRREPISDAEEDEFKQRLQDSEGPADLI